MRTDLEWKTDYKATNREQIAEFEKKCGYKFPQSYIDLVLKCNGAKRFNYIDAFDVYYETGEKANYGFGLGEFLVFGKENLDGCPITSLIDWVWEVRSNDADYPFPDHLVPINRDGGGNYVCLDYRKDPKTEEPEVVFWFHEEAGCLDEGLEVYFIAESFEEFLDCLYDDRTDEEKAEDVISRKEYLEEYGPIKVYK